MIVIALHLSPACLAHDRCICGHEETARMIRNILAADYLHIHFESYRNYPLGRRYGRSSS